MPAATGMDWCRKKYKAVLTNKTRESEITLPLNELRSPNDPVELIERYAFFTKYVFSCLTDADFLDTETFCDENIERGMSGDFKKALSILNERMKNMRSETKKPPAAAKSISYTLSHTQAL